ncbi:reverse transcriptase family protein [Mesorhizobium sp. XAP10]|uniref:reverse transcriptase family protein n=1 Tax=unclassified Mesorhizobium TaxID=325217 RepID=UPI0023DFA5F1|nr:MULTISPECIES: reverse transcriptase family protein [unclassified Mesorhizobium]MDF3150568.1 reverse transcriptase family protein [Mesorhizobium sp. XAP10]MDF3243454.1 reverse transcriptase family protein [Mesorhizobium sp. XAP4]
MAWHSGLEAKFIASVALDNRRYYSPRSIPKRRGGERSLFVPRPFLAGLQRWILDEILSKLSLHPSAFGFVKGRNTVGNAKLHAASKCILKIDIRDFFGSIKYAAVDDIFLGVGYSPKISYYLSRVCTLDDVLPQGAPTSPAISNIVMLQADVRIAEFCNQNGLLFSRYADDICLSGDLIPESAFPFLSDCLSNFGLEIAEEKTVLAFEGQKKIITGISISGGELRLPKESRRNLRQAIHYINRYGIESHKNNAGISDPIYKYRLLGQIEYWLSIEPHNETARLGKEILKLKPLK